MKYMWTIAKCLRSIKTPWLQLPSFLSCLPFPLLAPVVPAVQHLSSLQGHACTADCNTLHIEILKPTLNQVTMHTATRTSRQLCSILGKPEKLPGYSLVILGLNSFQHLYPDTTADHITHALDIFITKQKSLCEFLQDSRKVQRTPCNKLLLHPLR